MKNFNTTADRLKYLCSHFQITDADLSRELNNEVSSAAIGNIMRGRNQPSTKFLNAMLKYFPEINLNWVLTGQGKMFNALPTDAPVLNDAGIPIFPSNINPMEIEDPVKGVEFPRYEVPTTNVCDFMIYAKSSAMAPVIKKDDVLFCAKTKLDAFFDYNKTCLVFVGDLLLERKIQKTETGYQLVASHSSYPKIDIKPEEIKAVYYIHEVLRRL